jgi:hypothetical protein
MALLCAIFFRNCSLSDKKNYPISIISSDSKLYITYFHNYVLSDHVDFSSLYKISFDLFFSNNCEKKSTVTLVLAEVYYMLFSMNIGPDSTSCGFGCYWGDGR